MNDVFKLFSAKRRQYIITLLGMYDVGDEVTARHLARIVTAMEKKKEVQNIGSDGYVSAYNGLIQTHLPKFSDKDIIDYDARMKTVTVTEQTIASASTFMAMKALQ